MKKTLLFLMLGLWGIAAWAGPLQERNKTVARRVFDEIFNQSKFALADEIYAPGFVNHGLRRDIDLREDQEAARGWKLAFPDLKMTVVQEVAEGDLVTALWTATGTNTGEGNGFPATGRKMKARGITIWRIVNGKITEEWSAFDRLGPMQQLGLIPADAKQN